ncbi:30S ribosomal protein S6 [Candidatus Dojkabacteria bacterium]|nr:30S ribosomal protein S6 [Candidatus Dojkabacteria bacterium]
MKYELMIILKPLLPEDIKSKIINKIEGLIKENQGEIVSNDVWGKKHLAYPIKKHDEGYYVLYEMQMPTDNVKEFDSELGLINGVLRFLRVKRD